MEIKPLVCKIKIIKDLVDDSWKPPISGYGHLEMVRAEYYVLQSYNNDTA